MQPVFKGSQEEPQILHVFINFMSKCYFKCIALTPKIFAKEFNGFAVGRKLLEALISSSSPVVRLEERWGWCGQARKLLDAVATPQLLRELRFQT